MSEADEQITVVEYCELLFDYQSECHCSKTTTPHRSRMTRFDYQSECHCSKTCRW